MCLKKLNKDFVSARMYHEGRKYLSESMKDQIMSECGVSWQGAAGTLKQMYADGTFKGRKGVR